MLEPLTLSWSTQVMRKKSDTVTVVSNKIIAKRARVVATVGDRTTKHKVESTQPSVCAPPSPPLRASVSDQGGGNATGSGCAVEDTSDDRCSDTGGVERSVTAVESDLLKYLTAHITPPVLGGLTSFVISREEYLQGIVQLVKNDCPEVVQDIDSFMEAMQQAFRDTNHVTRVF